MSRIGRIALATALTVVVILCFAAAAVAEDGAGEFANEAMMDQPENTAPGGEAVRVVRFDEQAAPYAGVWVTFDDGFRLYLPGEWRSFELTEAQTRAGLFYRAGNDGGDSIVGQTPMGVAVSYVEAGGLTSLEALAADFASVGFASLEKLDLNGIGAVGFEKPEDGYRGVAFYHVLYPGYVMTVYVTSVAEAGGAVADAATAILESLTPCAPVGE